MHTKALILETELRDDVLRTQALTSDTKYHPLARPTSVMPTEAALAKV